MSLRVALDIDGVVADFRAAFEAMVVKVLDVTVDSIADPEKAAADPLSSRELDRVWKLIERTPNWWTTLSAYEPAQLPRLYKLSRELKWEVYFLTRRPETAGDPVQFQTQWWLESQGFYLPAVMTVPGSRGELASALRLDVAIDDQLHNCVDVVSESAAKAMLLQREPDQVAADHATDRGIGVVHTLEDAIDVLQRIEAVMVSRRGKLNRLADWFPWSRRRDESLPLNPRETRPLPTQEKG